MSTTAQKLEYLGTTKSQLKDMINYGLDEDNKITSSTTFRNYVSSIFNAFLESLRNPDTLFTNLPKKSVSGANITLNDTANAPMRIELGATELSQAGTPSPSTPYPIHTISGSNKIVVRGIQLFNNEDLEIGSIDVTTGANTNTSTSIRTKNYIIVESNTTYAFYRTESTNLKFRYYDKNYNYLGGYGASDLTTGTITTPNNTKFLRLTIDMSNDFNYKLQLQKGSTIPETFTSYSSQEADIDLGNIEYCKIGNYEDKFIRTSGKNLFDESTMQPKTSINASGVAESYDYEGGSELYIPVLPSTEYTFNCSSAYQLRVNKYTSDKTNIERISKGNATDFTFTTDANCYYIRLSFYAGGSTIVTQELLNSLHFWLEKTNQATPYEPYGSNEWYIKKNIGKETFDGSSDEGWAKMYSAVYNHKMLFNITTVSHDNTNYQNVISNLFSAIQGYTEYYPQGINCTYSKTKLVLVLDDTLLANYEVADLQALLSTTNLIAYIALETPTYTPITGTLETQLENVYKNMISQTKQTNISQENNDLSFELSVSAIEDLL